jgi:hypothetical protein
MTAGLRSVCRLALGVAGRQLPVAVRILSRSGCPGDPTPSSSVEAGAMEPQSLKIRGECGFWGWWDEDTA